MISSNRIWLISTNGDMPVWRDKPSPLMPKNDPRQAEYIKVSAAKKCVQSAIENIIEDNDCCGVVFTDQQLSRLAEIAFSEGLNDGE